VKARYSLELVIALAVMVILLVADVRVARPRRLAVAETGRQVEQAEQELKYLAGHAQELGQVSQFLPQPLEAGVTGDDRFLSQVSDGARRLNLAMTKVEPAGEQPYGNYVMRRYKLHFEGSYYGFAALLRSMESMPEIVTITGLECSSKELTNTGRHRATLEVAVVGR
jgi:Tfp pilus assembly protein PilO